MTDNETVVLRIFSDEIEAELARQHLEAGGIQSFIIRYDGGGVWTEHRPMPDIRLIVFTKDKEEAENILKVIGC